ncbi:MAG: tetratricopeptide repeat protein, partial [Acidobacteriota bacterium]
KAIALYNKISKLQPGSIEIAAKLAELYKFKGSINEARSQYKLVAEHHEREGRKIDALEVRKQIASLDPTDTAIQLNLAAAYLEENQPEQAAEAFHEAGLRFAKKSKHAEAIEAFVKALQVAPTDPKILAAFVQSHFSLGTAAVAAERLEEIYSFAPQERDVLHLLIDCHLEAGNATEAEKAIIGLVEKEPATYPKLVGLTRTYLKNGDVESSGRVMAMVSEHLLLAGDVDEFESLLSELMGLDPEQLEGLRLRARLSAWQRDDAGMHQALVQLATVARAKESVDDERFALSQLVMIAPHEIGFNARLKEINEQFGFDEAYAAGNQFDEQFLKSPNTPEPELETFTPVTPALEELQTDSSDGTHYADFAIVDESTNGGQEFFAEPDADADLNDDRLMREVDSIKFYIDSGYLELADKAISELRVEFGDRPEIKELAAHLEAQSALSEPLPEGAAPQAEVGAPHSEPGKPQAEVATNGQYAAATSGFGIDDLRSELGIDEVDSSNDSDYDTHYHTAVAYQEMGLLDEAVREFQDAVGLVQPNDPTRRFFHCANLLGHCFMQKSMPKHALTWYLRALETPGLGDEEKQGIWYELALAHEAEGDLDSAGRYFEQVYAENIDFRDVSQRVKNILVSR